MVDIVYILWRLSTRSLASIMWEVMQDKLPVGETRRSPVGIQAGLLSDTIRAICLRHRDDLWTMRIGGHVDSESALADIRRRP